MIEMNILQHAVEIASLVPVIASIYKIYLKNPLVVKNISEIRSAMAQIRNSPIEELVAGSHDVTPNESPLNYTINVFDKGDGDNIGTLQVSEPNGKPMTEMLQEWESGATTLGSSNGIAQLYSPGGFTQAIAERIGKDAEVKIFGLIAYRPKGEKVFNDK